MKHISFCITIALIINTHLKSQELVPNGSFENMTKLPTKETNHIFCTENWVVPSVTNADYYNRAAKGLWGGVPLNEFGKQEPRTGNAYAGFCIQSDILEYIEVALTQPMEKGKDYNVEFYISKADFRSATVKEFGVMFLDKVRFSYAATGIPKKPPVDFYLEEGYKNEKDWVKLSAVYTAEGFEAAIIIGYFNYDCPKGYKKKAHYYIDDVSITPVIHVNNTRGN